MKNISKCIQMIAWFDTNGKIHPIRFRYESDEEVQKIICIHSVLNTQYEKFAGNSMWKFTCKSVVDDECRIYDIKYDVLNSKWFLFNAL